MNDPIADIITRRLAAALSAGQMGPAYAWFDRLCDAGSMPFVLAGLALFFLLLICIHRRDRRTAAAAVETLDRLQTLLDNLPGAAYRCRPDNAWTMAFLSDGIEPLTGYPARDFINNAVHRFADLIHPDDRPMVAQQVADAVTARRAFTCQYRLLHADGKPVWVQDRGKILFDAGGRAQWIDGFLLDVTEQRQAQTERERLTVAIEQADETMVITDADGTIQYVNPAFERITGYSRDEAIGANPRIVKSDRQDAAFYRQMWETIAGGKVWQGRFINRRKDGSLYTEDANISPVRDKEGRIVNYVAVKRDVTRELSLEEQQRQRQKIESVGRLAGGVAHDFNNMLQAVFGHTEIALHLIEPGHPVREDLEAIRNAAQRSSDLTRQLLAFARKQAIEPQILDLNQSVSNTLKMLRQMIDETIDIVWSPAADLWLVEMDPVQVDQVLVNLCLNARDAIEGAGRIDIATRNATLTDDQAADREDRTAGDYVLLTVSDTGCGMDAETRTHLFEPFFTTKGMGHGTGLGLATSYGIIQQNRGAIDVATTPGKGTTFTVWLPRKIPPDAPPAAPPPDTPVTADTRHNTILVVEDEPSALKVTRILLEQAGYRVLAADSPQAAIRLAETHRGAIDLLLTDVVMPGMNGWSLSSQLTAADPKLACCFMSGYTADIIARHGVIEDGVHFIQKPFTAAALTAKVQQILAKT